MWLMLQQEVAEDFVIATNETHSVREFVEKSFGHINVKIRYVLLELIYQLDTCISGKLSTVLLSCIKYGDLKNQNITLK